MRRASAVCLAMGLLALVVAGCADDGAAPPELDTDNDTILDADEAARGTDATNPDSDGDVQGAALGPDGRAYMVMSANSSNPGGATVAVGDTPLEVVVQMDGPVLGAT